MERMPETISLSRRMVRAARRLSMDQLPLEVVEKVKTGFLDMLSCAFEARDLPWSCQAIQLASAASGRATVIGTPIQTSPMEAAFANATLGHGLVREDMHTGSVSHMGVVIFPALLALAQKQKASGRDFILGAVTGYEIGAAVGRAIMDQEMVRLYRPTGITGPLAASIAGSRLMGLDEEATISALGMAANATAGFNEWPYCGGDEMFFHAGFAARNAVTAVELASLGAFASETALDGRAGLFAALKKTDRIPQVVPFNRPQLEIMSVYYKPAPACNYAQTACQSALSLATQGVQTKDIENILVKVSAAAANYPGCDAPGPFERILQAKMSIHYCVAATLARGVIAESNYRLLKDPEIVRLARITKVEVDPALTAAYPGQQGSEVILTFRNGETANRRLADVVPATPAEIRERFRSACEQSLGDSATKAIEEMVDNLEHQDDIGALGVLLSAQNERGLAA